MCGGCDHQNGIMETPGGLPPESSEGARLREAMELDCDGVTMSDLSVYGHSSRKGTFVKLADVASLVAKPVPKGIIAMAVMENGGLRRPKKNEVGEDFVSATWLQEHRPEACGGEAVVRKRPDKAAMKKQREFESEKAVKCGLHSHLAEKSLLDPIRQRVRTVSEATNRAGLMLLDIVMRCQDDGVALPEMDQTFFYRLLTANEVEPAIRASMSDTFLSFPGVTRYMGDKQLYASAAAAMKTNFKNSVVFAFEPRQKRYVRAWCNQAPEARGEPWPIIKAINNWGLEEDLTPEATNFVQAERAAMGNPDAVNGTWLAGNVETVLRTYRRWLTFLESEGAKLYSITPVWKIRSHFIKLDTDAMFGLMNAEKLYRGNHDAFKEDSVAQFESVFKLSGLVSNRWTFSRMVETDGVTLSVHFKRSKTEGEIRSIEEKKKLRARSKLDAADRKETRARSPERLKAERAETRERKKKERAEAKAHKKGGDAPKERPKSEETKQDPELRDGDLSQDPGVSPNITYTVHIVDGKKVRRRFTIGRYNVENGVKRLNRRTALWLESVQHEQSLLDDISLKTATHAFVQAHIRRYATVHAVLWNEKTKSKWARGRFDTYIRKPASLDAFFKQIKKDGPVHRHFYGNGSKNSTMKGCKPVPGTLCLRRAKMAFQDTETKMVDEYLTTQCCWKCHSRTQPVASVVDGQRKRVRGLVFCDSRTCGCFTNRDYQGALNIMACGIGPRPAQLERTPVVGVKRTDVRMTNTSRRECAPWRPPRATPYGASQLGLSQN